MIQILTVKCKINIYTYTHFIWNASIEQMLLGNLCYNKLNVST